MFYIIDEISIEEDSKGIYASVRFWKNKGQFTAGKPPEIEEDFLWPQLKAVGEKSIQDSAGRYQLIDDTWITPEQMDDLFALEKPVYLKKESFSVDIKAEICHDIEKFWKHNETRPAQKKLKGIIKGKIIKRSKETDPKGLLKTEVLAMEKKQFETVLD